MDIERTNSFRINDRIPIDVNEIKIVGIDREFREFQLLNLAKNNRAIAEPDHILRSRPGGIEREKAKDQKQPAIGANRRLFLTR